MLNSREPVWLERGILLQCLRIHSTNGPANMSADSTVKPRSELVPLLVRGAISAVLIGLALLFAGRVFVALASQKKEPPREEPVAAVYRVEAYQIERQPIQRYVAGFGTAQADREVIVSAEVAGRITRTEHLRVGHLIQGPKIGIDEDGKSQRSTGQTIVWIDPQTYEERVKQAEAMVTQDQVELRRMAQDEASNLRLITQQEERLATARLEYDRVKDLLARKASNESEVSRAMLEMQQYQEALIRLQNERDLFPVKRQQLETQAATRKSDLTLAMLELEKAHVRAPFAGAISQVHVEEGQYVRPGEPLVQLTDADVVVVPIPVGLEDAAVVSERLASGIETLVELVPDELNLLSGGTIWHGRVARIAPTADERTRTVNIFVEINNRESESPLRPGTFVYARIEAEAIDSTETVLIPRDAIVNNAVFVVVAESSPEGARSPRLTARRVPLQVVRTMQSFALVRGELDESVQVVMTNLDIIADGVLLDVRQVHTLQDELVRLKVAYLKPVGPAE